MLPVKLQAELYLARRVAGRRDDAEGALIHGTVVLKAHTGIRSAELRMVERIERFHAKLQLASLAKLGERELFKEGHGGVRDAGLADIGKGARSVANCEVSGIRDYVIHIRKVGIYKTRTGVASQSASQVWSPSAIGGNSSATIERELNRPSAAKAESAIHLPAANDSIHNRIGAAGDHLPASNWEFVDIAELEQMGDIELRDGTFQVSSIGILQAGSPAQPGDTVIGGRSIID